MKNYEQFLKLPDYIYKSHNLDSDCKIILSVIISYQIADKALYMSQNTFSETYGMAIATVKRKFVWLKKQSLIKSTKRGLVIDVSELEFFLNNTKKINTRTAGPGRKKNQVDTLKNQVDSVEKNQIVPEQNQVDTAKNQVDSDERIKLIPKKNQVDTQLERLDKDIKKEIKKELPEDQIDDSFFDGIDLSQTYNYKNNLIEEPKKQVNQNDLEEFLKELDM